MSIADDILFAPIRPTPDFLIRQNRESGAYDWKPISARAANWVNKHFSNAYARSMHYEGWITNFSNEATLDDLVKHFSLMKWFDELIQDKYILEST